MSKKTWIVTSFILDTFAVNLAVITAFYFRFLGNPPKFNFSAYTSLAAFITFIYLISAYISSVYNLEDLLSSGFFEPVFKAVTICWLILGGFIWLYNALSFPRLVYVIGWILAIVFIYSWRFFSLNVLNINWPKQKILIVGTKPIAKDIILKLKSQAAWGYEIAGFADLDGSKKMFAGIPFLGNTANLTDLITKHSINRIIVTSSLGISILEKLAESGFANLKIEVVPDLYEILVGRVDYNTLTDIPLLELTRNNSKQTYAVFKRVLDIIGATGAILISFPLVVLPAAIIIRTTSKGDAFYKQERVGKNGKVFRMIKLRTMRQDAEKESGAVFAKKNDSRVTPVGRFLRKYRLDELPQFINILKGEMSFVGPRAERPQFVEKFKKEIPGYASRLQIAPGATGLAQISGSYTTDAKNKLKFDLFYLYHRSLFLDLKIAFKTVKVMVSGMGSH